MSKFRVFKGFAVMVLLYVLLSTGIVLGVTSTPDKIPKEILKEITANYRIISKEAQSYYVVTASIWVKILEYGVEKVIEKLAEWTLVKLEEADEKARIALQRMKEIYSEYPMIYLYGSYEIINVYGPVDGVIINSYFHSMY